MCKMRVVIRKELLGAREQGWSVWTGKDVQELTSKQIKDIIRAGKEKICGLKIGESGELELDREGYFTRNLMEHRMCNNFKPMFEEDSMANMMYTVIGCCEEAGSKVYDCISNRFEQAKLTELEVKTYIKIGIISSGAKMEGDNIVVASLEYPKVEEAKEVKQEVTEPKLEEKKPEPVVENPLDDKIVSVEKVEVPKPGKGKK
uniref:hypothetical protein n=1 Tax=Acetatifactor sp. TaxID=1872090 RepID=UPI0040565A7C